MVIDFYLFSLHGSSFLLFGISSSKSKYSIFLIFSSVFFKYTGISLSYFWLFFWYDLKFSSSFLFYTTKKSILYQCLIFTQFSISYRLASSQLSAFNRSVKGLYWQHRYWYSPLWCFGCCTTLPIYANQNVFLFVWFCPWCPYSWSCNFGKYYSADAIHGGSTVLKFGLWYPICFAFVLSRLSPHFSLKKYLPQ